MRKLMIRSLDRDSWGWIWMLDVAISARHGQVSEQKKHFSAEQRDTEPMEMTSCWKLRRLDARLDANCKLSLLQAAGTTMEYDIEGGGIAAISKELTVDCRCWLIHAPSDRDRD